jgi:hypothetical protein
MSERRWADKVLEADPDLVEFFLGRLGRLVARQATATDLAERTALGMATFSTFLDCLDLGLAEQAYGIIKPVCDELDLGEDSAA